MLVAVRQPAFEVQSFFDDLATGSPGQALAVDHERLFAGMAVVFRLTSPYWLDSKTLHQDQCMAMCGEHLADDYQAQSYLIGSVRCVKHKLLHAVDSWPIDSPKLHAGSWPPIFNALPGIAFKRRQRAVHRKLLRLALEAQPVL